MHELRRRGGGLGVAAISYTLFVERYELAEFELERDGRLYALDVGLHVASLKRDVLDRAGGPLNGTFDAALPGGTSERGAEGDERAQRGQQPGEHEQANPREDPARLHSGPALSAAELVAARSLLELLRATGAERVAARAAALDGPWDAPGAGIGARNIPAPSRVLS